jgi:hypothetical protein
MQGNPIYDYCYGGSADIACKKLYHCYINED